MTSFLPGRRVFTSACIATIVVSFLHTIGNTLPEPPREPEYFGLLSVMHGYKVPLGLGMSPSVWDIYRCLVFTMSICLVAMGAFGLTVGSSRDATPRLISRMAMVGAVSSGALTALSGFYRIPPPMITMGMVTILFAIAVRTSR